jgi:hypothetical protein
MCITITREYPFPLARVSNCEIRVVIYTILEILRSEEFRKHSCTGILVKFGEMPRLGTAGQTIKVSGEAVTDKFQN